MDVSYFSTHYLLMDTKHRDFQIEDMDAPIIAICTFW